jgi:N-acetyl-gamma-glutamyl-phosphate reductase
MQNTLMLLDSGIRVIDLAADFRFQRSCDWEKWYGMPHACPDLLSEAVYGLPEINREAISRARLVANPGCYPTVIQLGFLPLLEASIVDPLSLIADAKSGISGAGRKAKIDILFSEAAENFRAYNVSGHRHWPEISQGLMRIANGPVNLVFVPHLIPMIRGMHATLYATLIDTRVDLQDLFTKRYSNEPFVDVLESESHPETRSVHGLNYCRLAVHRPQRGKTVVILSVIDNLVKGAAGQAVQNMNLMFGLPETAGLEGVGLMP